MGFSESCRALCVAVLEGPGATSRELRQRVNLYAQSLARRSDVDNPFDETLGRWVEKVARFAYKTLPDEVEAMKRDGKSEDEIFELTVAAALGAASGRYDCALDSIDAGYAE